MTTLLTVHLLQSTILHIAYSFFSCYITRLALTVVITPGWQTVFLKQDDVWHSCNNPEHVPWPVCRSETKGPWPAGFFLSGYFQGKRDAERALAATFPTSGVALRPSFVHGSRQVGSVSIPLSAIGQPILLGHVTAWLWLAKVRCVGMRESEAESVNGGVVIVVLGSSSYH